MLLTTSCLRTLIQAPFGIPARLRDRGGAAAVAAVLLGTGSLFGVSTIVIDVGQLYTERQELQTGADAAAVAIARNCVVSPSACASQATTIAAAQANANAKDNRSRVTLICGTPGTGLASCPENNGRLTDCVGSSSGGDSGSGSFVQVYTATETSDGHTKLGTAFANLATGTSAAQDGVEVGACARANWGPAGSGAGVAVTISTCAWNQFTGSGAKLAAPPPATATANYESYILLHGTGSTCAAGTSGWNAPGGFGWLDENGGACKAQVTTNNSVDGNTGVSASCSCKSSLSTARANRTVLMMPVFDGVRGTGANTVYHIRGFSAFVVTGYALPGFSASSVLTGKTYCKGNEKCIYGYFTTGIMSGAPSWSSSSFGVSATGLAG